MRGTMNKQDEEAKMKKRTFYKHPSAIVDTDRIGEGTRIWAFSHVLKDARIGKDCNIGEGCFIESGVKIGDEVTVKNGVALWEGVIAEDRVFIGPYAAFTNDLYPRSKGRHLERGKTLLKKGSTVGANATIVCGVTIGSYAMVGAGAVVTKDVPDHGLVYGNPAALKGYVCRCGMKLKFIKRDAECVCGCGYALGASGLILERSKANVSRR